MSLFEFLENLLWKAKIFSIIDSKKVPWGKGEKKSRSDSEKNLNEKSRKASAEKQMAYLLHNGLASAFYKFFLNKERINTKLLLWRHQIALGEIRKNCLYCPSLFQIRCGAQLLVALKAVKLILQMYVIGDLH